MKTTRLDHVGIAVRSIDQALAVWEGILGLEAAGVEEVADQKVRVAFLPVGDSEVELLESTTPDGAVARFIEKNGEGVQHLAFRVDDLDAALAALGARGVRLIDQKPRPGAGGARIAFLHPGATGGVLIELCEREL